jgi:hypothetical protein
MIDLNEALSRTFTGIRQIARSSQRWEASIADKELANNCLKQLRGMKTSMGVATAGTPWMAFPSPEKTHAKCTKLCIFEECARGVTISSSLRLFSSNGRLESLLNGSHFLFLLVMIFAPLLTFEDLAQSFGVSVYRLGDISIVFNGE